MPFNILDLPWELRSQILEEIILSHRNPPSYPAVKAETRTPLEKVMNSGDRPDDFWTSNSKHIKWLINSPLHPASALLLLNHQLNYEAKLVRQRLTNSRTCQVDILFAEEETLYPTLLSAYTSSTHFDLLHTQLRIVGLRPESEQYYNWGEHFYRMSSMLHLRDRPPHGAQLSETFLSLLHSFVRVRPPLSIGDTKTEDRRNVVSVIELNVLSHHTDTDESLLPPQGIKARHWFMARENKQDNLHDFLLRTQMRPEWLSDWLGNQLEIVLSPTSFNISHIESVYQCVGEIKVLLDGVVQKELRLGELLSDFDPIARDIETRRRLEKWQETTLSLREQRGLPATRAPTPPPVAWDSDSETNMDLN